jgi:hypothetical protein
MPPRRFLGLLGLAACLLAGCQPAATSGKTPAGAPPDVALGWSVAPDPPAAGPVRLTLTLTGAGRRPVAGAAVRLEANMSHPGMRPVFGTAREVAPGRYEAPLDLTMGGDWFFLIDATLPGGGTLRRQVDLPGVRPR